MFHLQRSRQWNDASDDEDRYQNGIDKEFSIGVWKFARSVDTISGQIDNLIKINQTLQQDGLVQNGGLGEGREVPERHLAQLQHL